MSDVAERARLRIREEMNRKRLSQRDLAGILGGWSQSRVAKLLTGRVAITLEDLEALCFAVGLSPVEAVRDHGLEFVAEMTPSELQTLGQLRDAPKHIADTIRELLKFNSIARIERRHAGPRKKK